MEDLKFVIDNTAIIELLGKQNFTNEESAVLELVKNSYDANALSVHLIFGVDSLKIIDDGEGMSEDDIKKKWMHVGHSDKGYEMEDIKSKKRVQAGSKGIGRLALSRLGNKVTMFSRKKDMSGVVWKTDWNNTTLSYAPEETPIGTEIIITELRQKWTKRRTENLCSFISKTYNDNSMSVVIDHPELGTITTQKFFKEPVLGNNCLCIID